MKGAVHYAKTRLGFLGVYAKHNDVCAGGMELLLGGSSPPLCVPSASIYGDVIGTVWMQNTLGYLDEATSWVDYNVTAKCTGNSQTQNVHEAVQVKNDQISSSLGAAGGSFNWTPSGTGPTASMVKLLPNAVASNAGYFQAVFAETNINLFQCSAEVKGDNEQATSSAFISVSVSAP